MVSLPTIPISPREAKLLHDLSYDEAHALAAGGAKVLPSERACRSPPEMEMTIWIRNTFKPHARGTRIGLPKNASEVGRFGGAA